MDRQKKNHSRFPQSKIKRIMQADEDIGMISSTVNLLVSTSLELFIKDLSKKAADITKERGSVVISKIDLKTLIFKDEMFDFLREKMESVSDESEEIQPKKKPKKSSKDEKKIPNSTTITKRKRTKEPKKTVDEEGEHIEPIDVVEEEEEEEEETTI